MQTQLRWTYSAFMSKHGRPCADFTLVDLASLPTGCPTFDTRREAVAAYRLLRQQVHVDMLDVLKGVQVVGHQCS